MQSSPAELMEIFSCFFFHRPNGMEDSYVSFIQFCNQQWLTQGPVNICVKNKNKKQRNNKTKPHLKTRYSWFRLLVGTPESPSAKRNQIQVKQTTFVPDNQWKRKKRVNQHSILSKLTQGYLFWWVFLQTEQLSCYRIIHVEPHACLFILCRKFKMTETRSQCSRNLPYIFLK